MRVAGWTGAALVAMGALTLPLILLGFVLVVAMPSAEPPQGDGMGGALAAVGLFFLAIPLLALALLGLALLALVRLALRGRRASGIVALAMLSAAAWLLAGGLGIIEEPRGVAPVFLAVPGWAMLVAAAPFALGAFLPHDA